MDVEGRLELEINNRVASAAKTFYAQNKAFIRKREVKKDTNIRIYNSVYVTVLTYGCKGWAWEEQNPSL